MIELFQMLLILGFIITAVMGGFYLGRQSEREKAIMDRLAGKPPHE